MGSVGTVECPSCSAPVERVPGVRTVSCPYCGTAIVSEEHRKEFQAEEILEKTKISYGPRDRGPLGIDTAGFYNNQGFVIKGVIEYRDSDGWTWQEYFIKFNDGRVAWLEYDDGDYFLNFEIDEEFKKGMFGVKIGNDKMKVKEKGTSIINYQHGHLPFSYPPDTKIKYIDGRSTKDPKKRYSVEYTDNEVEVYEGAKVRVEKSENHIDILRL